MNNLESYKYTLPKKHIQSISEYSFDLVFGHFEVIVKPKCSNNKKTKRGPHRTQDSLDSIIKIKHKRHSKHSQNLVLSPATKHMSLKKARNALMRLCHTRQILLHSFKTDCRSSFFSGRVAVMSTRYFHLDSGLYSYSYSGENVSQRSSFRTWASLAGKFISRIKSRAFLMEWERKAFHDFLQRCSWCFR